jgi:hypothetical protein
MAIWLRSKAKEAEVEGTNTLHKGRPQIVLSSPQSLRPAGAASQKEPNEPEPSSVASPTPSLRHLIPLPHPPFVPLDAVADYVGKTVTIVDTVKAIFSSPRSGIRYLSFGDAYPWLGVALHSGHRSGHSRGVFASNRPERPVRTSRGDHGPSGLLFPPAGSSFATRDTLVALAGLLSGTQSRRVVRSFGQGSHSQPHLQRTTPTRDHLIATARGWSSPDKVCLLVHHWMRDQVNATGAA